MLGTLVNAEGKPYIGFAFPGIGTQVLSISLAGYLFQQLADLLENVGYFDNAECETPGCPDCDPGIVKH